MIRYWTAAAVALASVALAGCSSSDAGMLAAAPTSKPGMSYTAHDSGRYTLYHATRLTDSDRPDPGATQQVGSFDVRAGESLGFNWVTDKAHQYDPDAHINLVAYAGSHRINLGGINSPNELYFWGR
jgi:hypothetical protein